jgi:hypothetical protein
MKIGIRLPQTGEDYATKENIIHLAKETENAAALNFYEECVCNKWSYRCNESNVTIVRSQPLPRD